MISRRRLAVLSVILLALLACQSSSLPGLTRGTALPVDVLFQDDFANPQSGWKRVNDPAGSSDYAGGRYRITVNSASSEIWANPGLSFTDAAVEVDATQAGGPDNNLFGVVCRYADPEHFYFFALSSDGYYGIGKMNDGRMELIDMQAFEPSEAILRGKQTNHIRAECAGEALRLYANGQKLAEVQDADYARGDAGLIAGTLEKPGTDILFDNFAVRQVQAT